MKKPWRIDILIRIFCSDEQLVYGQGECGPVCSGEVACRVRIIATEWRERAYNMGRRLEQRPSL